MLELGRRLLRRRADRCLQLGIVRLPGAAAAAAEREAEHDCHRRVPLDCLHSVPRLEIPAAWRRPGGREASRAGARAVRGSTGATPETIGAGLLWARRAGGGSAGAAPA